MSRQHPCGATPLAVAWTAAEQAALPILIDNLLAILPLEAHISGKFRPCRFPLPLAARKSRHCIVGAARSCAGHGGS